MGILSIVLIGVGLSMDAFSLALSYGMLNLKNKQMLLLAVIVGIYHFFMPLLGMAIGDTLMKYISMDMRYVVFAIFMYLGIEMLFSFFDKKTSNILINIVGFLLFGFTVSIDSFSAGIGIHYINDNLLLCSTVFSLTSFSFTFVGLKLGNILSNKVNVISKLLGSLILIVFAIIYLFK